MKRMFTLIAALQLLVPFFVAQAADPILIAHRGLLQHAPENTIPAFASCLELGMGFELDIRTTRDGKLVVLHDATLARTTNGPNRAISEITWKELRQLDAGSWFAPRFSGLRVPSLEETFALVRERKRRPTLLALNVKSITREGERELLRLLEKFKLFKESFAFDQSAECSERLKALDPRIRIGRNIRREEIDSRLAEGATDVYLLTSVPNEADVSLLRKHRKAILFNYAGTGEHRREKKNWLRVRELGIDGMLTDYALECAKLWQANPLENETQKKP